MIALNFWAARPFNRVPNDTNNKLFRNQRLTSALFSPNFEHEAASFETRFGLF